MKLLRSNDKKLIALVEPDAKAQLSLLTAIKNVGTRNPLLLFNDGQEVLEHYFPKNDVTDRRIPGLVLLSGKEASGLDVLKRFKSDQRMAEVPFLIFCEGESEVPAKQVYDEGAASLINKQHKQLSFDEVAEVLSEYWLSHCQLPGN